MENWSVAHLPPLSTSINEVQPQKIAKVKQTAHRICLKPKIVPLGKTGSTIFPAQYLRLLRVEVGFQRVTCLASEQSLC